MEQVKTALKNLEESVVDLEQAIYASKKTRTQADEKITELKSVVRTAYDRLDRALSAFKKGEDEA